MRNSNFALRLQPSLLDELREVASAEDVTLNHFINVAVAEKLAALRAESYWRKRAKRGNVPKALKILERLGVGNPPRRDDRIPQSYLKKIASQKNKPRTASNK